MHKKHSLSTCAGIALTLLFSSRRRKHGPDPMKVELPTPSRCRQKVPDKGQPG